MEQLDMALREIGRIERTLFIIDWLLDIDMQRRANIGLNKGEAYHVLKGALRIGRQGEIRDKTTEGQHLRRWPQLTHRRHHLLEFETDRHRCSKATKDWTRLLSRTPAHISPLGWAHIIPTGEYRWPKCRLKPLKGVFYTQPEQYRRAPLG